MGRAVHFAGGHVSATALEPTHVTLTARGKPGQGGLILLIPLGAARDIAIAIGMAVNDAEALGRQAAED